MKVWMKQITKPRATGLTLSCMAMATFGGCRPNFSGFLGNSDFLVTGKTQSFFTAVQVDPQSEDSAGPQFVAAEDLNGDGLLDLVSAWNQSQPVQIHLQRRNADGTIRFESLTLAGNTPVVRVAGLVVTDFDLDGHADIAVLVKESGLTGPGCLNSELPPEGSLSGLIVMYFGPTDPAQTNQALGWSEVVVEASRLAGRSGPVAGPPEEEGFTRLAVGDMDLDGDSDMVVAWNSACGDPATPQTVFLTNQGPTAVRDGTWAAATIPDPFPKGPIVSDQMGIERIKDVGLGDLDRDGDLDIVATFPDAGSLNIRWYRNPAVDTPDDFHISDGTWQTGMVGQVEPRRGFSDLGGPDTLRVADMDRDGILDVVMRSTGGRVIQWLKGPAGPTTFPIRQLAWQVFTLAEFTQRTPQSIALGDLDNDGRLELIATAEGAVSWFGPQGSASVFDQWTEHVIIDDRPTGPGSNSPGTTDPNVSASDVGESTFINSILLVDLDGDGRNDLVLTLDRSGLSGLSNDALVWFRNTR